MVGNSDGAEFRITFLIRVRVPWKCHNSCSKPSSTHIYDNTEEYKNAEEIWCKLCLTSSTGKHGANRLMSRYLMATGM